MVETIKWDGSSLRILDQTRLPSVIEYRDCQSSEDVADSIRRMLVRGAPAIGVTAAFGMVLAVREALHHDDFRQYLHDAALRLKSTRPTAVNLFWAIDKMMSIASHATRDGLEQAMEAAARSMYEDDIRHCRAIGRYADPFIPSRAVILTHCNAGALATAGYGTALGVIRRAIEIGKDIRVFADETRPFLQGARLTAWELSQDGIDTTLITDNMAAHFMAKGEIDLVVVGADRIAANGDTANKIGTYYVALAAKAHQIPFYVAAPTSTIDLSIPNGSLIPIEERDPREVTWIGNHPIAPSGIKVKNPAFDVTPYHLISAIITDKGAVSADFVTGLKALVDSGQTDAGIQ